MSRCTDNLTQVNGRRIRHSSPRERRAVPRLTQGRLRSGLDVASCALRHLEVRSRCPSSSSSQVGKIHPHPWLCGHLLASFLLVDPHDFNSYIGARYARPVHVYFLSILKRLLSSCLALATKRKDAVRISGFTVGCFHHGDSSTLRPTIYYGQCQQWINQWQDSRWYRLIPRSSVC
jgi:hypothetical protein